MLESTSKLLNQTDKTRIEYFDGWRGLAITLVLLSHFFYIPFMPILGRLGVDLFFVLSGLLVSKILFVERSHLNKYIVHRISRIIPAFLFFTLTLHLASYLFNLSNEHNNLIYTLLTIRNYIPTQPDVWNTGLPMGHLWTLNVEIHCYIVLGIIAAIRIFKGIEHWLLFTLGFCCLILTYLYGNHFIEQPPLYILRTESAASHILFSAGYFLIKENFKPFIKCWMPICALILAFITYSNASPHGSFYWLISPFLLAFAVNHLEASYKPILQFFSLKPLRYLGILSYSVYLWQELFYVYADKIFLPFPGRGLLLIILSILVGICSFYLIEQPARKKINGLLKSSG